MSAFSPPVVLGIYIEMGISVLPGHCQLVRKAVRLESDNLQNQLTFQV